MLIIFGAFDGLTQQGRWQEFFNIFGLAVSVVGVLAIFLVKDEPGLKRGSDSYFKNLLYGFRPSVVKENPELYLSFAAFCLFSVAVQVFFPYLIIYIQNYLGITDYAIVLGVVLILASVVSVVSGHFIDRLVNLRLVLLPMVTGPAIGAAVIKNGASTYVELGQVKTVPTPGIYLAAAAVLLLTFVPILVLRRKEQ